MKSKYRNASRSVAFLAITVVFAIAIGVAQAQEQEQEQGQNRCKNIRADLVEVPATEGCNPGLTSCFLGELHGNHGFSGTTHFKADSGAAGPSTSPGFISYSGVFEYRTGKGELFVRETGVTNPAVVTAHHKITSGTGDYTGATGDLFVSGHKSSTGIITTEIFGQICKPPR